MSRIYFHSPSGEAEIRGAERAWAGLLVGKIGLGILDPGWYENEARILAALRPPMPYPMRPGMGDLACHLRVRGSELELELADGQRAGVWEVLLNTALRVGNDPMRLLARLHAQCEIHAWVDGPNRSWLADMVEEGRRDGLMRADQGWESVVTLLCSRSDEPVVTSYSVCEQFPHNSNDWKTAMTELRAGPGALELKPDGWQTYSFGVGASALDILRRLKGAAGAAGART